MWICQKCNTRNKGNFCSGCGTAANENNDELAPTVFVMPSAGSTADQSADSQSQPNFAQNRSTQTPQFQMQNPQAPESSPPQVSAPRKSNVKKFVIAGGVVAVLMLVVLAAGGFALWRGVIEPKMMEQRRAEIERDNQNRADSATAMSIMPMQFTYYGAAGDVYLRKETLEKLQFLQAAQNLPPELKQKTDEISDAAAAVFVSDRNSSQKVVLQIFKFNTPAQAKFVCQQMLDEFEKKREQFKSVTSLSGSLREGYCRTSVEGKNNEKIALESQYGFLHITSGDEKNPVESVSEMISNQLGPY